MHKPFMRIPCMRIHLNYNNYNNMLAETNPHK